MSEGPYFDGDPATDSARRHMERVLKGEPPPRRWPWVLAALGGGGLVMLFRLGRSVRAGAAEPNTRARGGTDPDARQPRSGRAAGGLETQRR